MTNKFRNTKGQKMKKCGKFSNSTVTGKRSQVQNHYNYFGQVQVKLAKYYLFDSSHKQSAHSLATIPTASSN